MQTAPPSRVFQAIGLCLIVVGLVFVAAHLGWVELPVRGLHRGRIRTPSDPLFPWLGACIGLLGAVFLVGEKRPRLRANLGLLTFAAMAIVVISSIFR
ncbi:hypothetical protein [Armatimonas rosea]|uniref:Drug/metabolite transporter (DMT)-like permease n=1 Tax=Armatimonas rosea TaxID=685828 RepID=A0A7W9W5D2_ARMRO|nr:hypothetical protein [Armatimonas rosea]MBB6048810.1 drug/metabolite transporter (DMT)-like permease [Armatimonas rosea]